MSARRLAVAPVLLVLALAVRSRAYYTVVDAADAGAYVGSTVTVEGDVATARTEPSGLVLELAPADPKGFRVVVAWSMFSSLPRSPERIYGGKRVRVTGLVRRFQGRPEIDLEGVGQIEIVDLAGAPAATSTSLPPAPAESAPRAAAAPPAVPAPSAQPPTPPPAAVAASAPPVPAPTPSPAAGPTAAAAVPAVPSAAATVPSASPPVEPTADAAPPPEASPRPLLSEVLAARACESAKARWQEAAERVRAASDALARCLDAGSFACRESAARLAPALGDLEWAEQRVGDACD